MQGSLHTYFETLPAFVSTNNSNSKRFFVFLHGLWGGLQSVGYTPDLFNALLALNIPVAQPLLSSSYTGFGTSTILQDVQEISQFLLWLGKTYGAQSFILCGHSTGCQNLVRLLSFLSGDFSGASSQPTPYAPRTPVLSPQKNFNSKAKLPGSFFKHLLLIVNIFVRR